MNNKKRIIIVEDNYLVRERIKVLLNNSDTIEVISEASNGKEFLDIVKEKNPDAVLMDILMPVMDGIEATKHGIANHPDLKVLALSMFGDEENYFKMLQAGVKGFILKSAGISELEKAIIAVSDNKNYFSSELLPQIITILNDKDDKSIEMAEDVSSLTTNEIAVLKLVIAGLKNEDIAYNLNVSVPLVKSYRSNILSKIYCKKSARLGIYVIKNNIAV